MSLLLLDTSALMKLYLPELGSAWIQAQLANNEIVISELALYEGATVLRRRYLEGTLTLAQASALYAQLQNDTFNFEIIELRVQRQLERVIDLAFNLPQNLRLRALDSIHIVAAQIVAETNALLNPPETFTFVSADRQLLQIAQQQGFLVENPENYL